MQFALGLVAGIVATIGWAILITLRDRRRNANRTCHICGQRAHYEKQNVCVDDDSIGFRSVDLCEECFVEDAALEREVDG